MQCTPKRRSWQTPGKTVMCQGRSWKEMLTTPRASDRQPLWTVPLAVYPMVHLPQGTWTACRVLWGEERQAHPMSRTSNALQVLTTPPPANVCGCYRRGHRSTEWSKISSEVTRLVSGRARVQAQHGRLSLLAFVKILTKLDKPGKTLRKPCLLHMNSQRGLEGALLGITSLAPNGDLLGSSWVGRKVKL